MVNQLFYDGSTTGDAGDQYVGLDRFGRVVDLVRQNRSDDPLDHFPTLTIATATDFIAPMNSITISMSCITSAA
ncbi:MAG: hypothetical protein ACJ8C4_15170 [Gemmataceae bacterium]